jgi:hypothetical protein
MEMKNPEQAATLVRDQTAPGKGRFCRKIRNIMQTIFI